MNVPKEKIAVIGSGIIGLCAALECLHQNYSVTLIDSVRPGEGASFGNAGYLATELIDPLSNRKTLFSALSMLLDPNGPLALPFCYLHKSIPWLAKFIAAAKPVKVNKARKALSELNHAAIPAWKRCLERIGAQEYLCQTGYLLVWESARSLNEAKKHASYLKQWGVETVLVKGEELARLEPALSTSVSHALYFPEAFKMTDPYKLCLALFFSFEKQGGVFVQKKVDHLHFDEDNIFVKTNAEELKFKKAIVCSGAWSAILLKTVGLNVPLEAERGYHITYENSSVTLNRPIGSAERRFVLSPLTSGLRAVGFTELGGLYLKPFKKRYNVLRKHSEALIEGIDVSNVKIKEWMGRRPTLPDSLPVIDCHPKSKNLLFSFGHHHLGLTQAAISAELVVGLMKDKVSSIELTPYRVNRF